MQAPKRDDDDELSTNLPKLREQVLDGKVKIGMLLSELEAAKVHAEENGKLRARCEDLQVGADRL